MSSSVSMKSSFSPWLIRWVVGSILLAGLAWMIFFSHEAAPHTSSHTSSHSKRDSLRSTSSSPSSNGTSPSFNGVSPSSNGTELLVRAYTIADRTANTPSQRTFSGTLQARYQSLLGFRVAGKIVERHVEVGDRVRKGQVLFRLDPTDFDLQIQVAESDLQAAKSQLIQIEAEERRLADLRQTRSASQSDYDLALAARDTARARLRAAENRLMMAKNQRDYAQLEVDQDGLVTKIMAEVGQVVSPGQPVVQWVHGSEMEAAISVPESMQHMLDHRSATVRFWSNRYRSNRPKPRRRDQRTDGGDRASRINSNRMADSQRWLGGISQRGNPEVRFTTSCHQS